MKKVIEEKWSINKLIDNGKFYILRFNQAYWEPARRPKFNYQIGLAIPFNIKTENGFPTESESKQLYEIEDDLFEALNPKNALFVGTIVGNGMKEFVIYSSDYKRTKLVIDKIKHMYAEHQFQVAVQEDTNWDIYKTYCPQQI